MKTTEKDQLIDVPVWKSKSGDIPMAQMEEDHIQRAYNYAEYRFMLFENQAINAAEKAALFEEKLQQLEKEAGLRGADLKSISSKNPDKFNILRQRKRVKAIA